MLFDLHLAMLPQAWILDNITALIQARWRSTLDSQISDTDSFVTIVKVKYTSTHSPMLLDLRLQSYSLY